MCLILMFRSNNQKSSDQRYGGNWRTEAAKYASIVGGIGALGALGYGGYKAHQGYQALKKGLQTAKEIYTGAQDAMAAKGALEAVKMAQEGAAYMPPIPGGFPSAFL